MTSHCSAPQTNFKSINSKPKQNNNDYIWILSLGFKIHFKIWTRKFTQIPIFKNLSQNYTTQKYKNTCDQGYS